MNDLTDRLTGISTFVQLEREIRHARTPDAFRFVAVNETRRLLTYHQAILASGGGKRLRVEAVSNVAVLDRHAPFLRWLARLLSWIGKQEWAGTLREVEATALPQSLAQGWADWMPARVLWCPLIAPDGGTVGGFCLTRDAPWTEGERLIAERLADCFAHAWIALEGRRRVIRPRRFGRVVAALVGVAVVAVMAVPVRLSALAPAEIVGQDATVVAAPMDGVISTFHVSPSATIEPGQLLFALDDTNLRAELEVAERTVGIAEAEARRAAQGAFGDREAGGQVAILEAQANLRRTELDYATERLDRIAVRADRAGVAIFTDANDWIGRPVVTGQRILQIADPERIELDIHLPVADALVGATGAPVDLFLDIDPLNPITGRVVRASYEATPRPDGTLAYLLKAELHIEGPMPRIGLRGTASVQGAEVPLFFYLFRRPIAAIRQTVGW